MRFASTFLPIFLESFFDLILSIFSSLSAVYKPVVGPVTEAHGGPISCSFMLCCWQSAPFALSLTQTASINIQTSAKVPWMWVNMQHSAVSLCNWNGILSHFCDLLSLQGWWRFKNNSKAKKKNQPLLCLCTFLMWVLSKMCQIFDIIALPNECVGSGAVQLCASWSKSSTELSGF